MENFTNVKLEIFVPQEYALKIRDQLAKIGIGRIGDYDHCVAITTVQGYFRPLPGANPFDGRSEEFRKRQKQKSKLIAGGNW